MLQTNAAVDAARENFFAVPFLKSILDFSIGVKDIQKEREREKC